jgi:hypothetical protein
MRFPNISFPSAPVQIFYGHCGFPPEGAPPACADGDPGKYPPLHQLYEILENNALIPMENQEK